MTEPRDDQVVDGELVEDGAAPPPPEPTGYTEGGVPTFDFVRERVEGRYGTSIGSAELADESAAGRAVDEQFAERERAGRDKLEQIRRSMRKE